MWECNPLRPAENGELAFLFLSELAARNLQRWGDSRDQWHSERVVPHVEAGHVGDIPLEHVEEIILVSLRFDGGR